MSAAAGKRFDRECRVQRDAGSARRCRRYICLHMAEQSNPDEDPGWPPWTSALAFMVPGLMQSRLRRSGTDGLTLLRQITMSFSASTVLFGVVLAFVRLRGGRVLLSLVIVAVLAFVVTAIERTVERPLDCSSITALAGSYRTRFFLRVAFAETVALFGFVRAFHGGTMWVYSAGAAFTLARFWTVVAPTRSALAQDQLQLNARGCGLSLIASLRSGRGSAD